MSGLLCRQPHTCSLAAASTPQAPFTLRHHHMRPLLLPAQSCRPLLPSGTKQHICQRVMQRVLHRVCAAAPSSSGASSTPDATAAAQEEQNKASHSTAGTSQTSSHSIHPSPSPSAASPAAPPTISSSTTKAEEVSTSTVAQPTSSASSTKAEEVGTSTVAQPTTSSSTKAEEVGASDDEEYEEGEWDEYEEYEEGEYYDEEEEEEDDVFLEPYDGPTELPYEEGKFLEVGTVMNAHGIRGEVKVYPSTDSPRQRFRPGSRLWLQPFASKLQKTKPMLNLMTVETGRPSITKHGTVWLVKMEEVPTRTEAEGLKRGVLWVARDDLPPARDGEIYLTDLIGMKVVHQEGGQEVGEVVDVFADLTPYDTIRVKLVQTTADIEASQYRSVLIPLVPDICPVVDGERRVIELDAPEGLLDLVSVTRLGKKKKKTGATNSKGKSSTPAAGKAAKEAATGSDTPQPSA